MNRLRSMALWAMCVLAVGLAAGCGGGGDSNNGQDAAALVQRGTDDLNKILRGTDQPTAAKLKSIADTFSQARSKDSANKRAAFGYAVGTVAYNAQQVVDLATARGRATGPDNPLVQTARQLSPWGMPVPGKETTKQTVRFAIGAPLAVTRLRQAASPAEIRTAVTNLRTAVTEAITALLSVESDASFTFVIADYRSGAAPTATLSVDQGDVQAFLTSLYAARALLAMALAYDVDGGTFDFSQSISTRFAAQIATGAPVTPNDYLPPAPFGGLTSEGAALLASAKSDLITGAGMAEEALNTLQARTTQTGHVLDATSLDFGEVRDGVNQFRNALNNTIPIEIEEGVTVTVNLNAWFTNPPSLRGLMPTYSPLGPNELIAAPGAYPDATLGGLLVNPPVGFFSASVSTGDRVGALAEDAFALSD